MEHGTHYVLARFLLMRSAFFSFSLSFQCTNVCIIFSRPSPHCLIYTPNLYALPLPLSLSQDAVTFQEPSVGLWKKKKHVSAKVIISHFPFV
jgi:hypothetical protein